MPRSAEFHCEVCGTTTNTPTHWVVIECGDLCLTVFRWNLQAATAGGPRRLCGEAHARFTSAGGSIRYVLLLSRTS